MSVYEVEYVLQGAGGVAESFKVRINQEQMRIIDETPSNIAPEWTRLGFMQCANCPLKEATTPVCPVARQLIRVADFSNKFKSYDKLAVKVTTEERAIIGKTSAQVAFSSLIGLMTVTSGCPHFDYLKPMARFHLPLASVEETVYRVFSMYMLSQYFRQKSGKKVDFDLSTLKRVYEQIEIVNTHMTERLRAAVKTDASLNAVVCLDTFAKTMLCVIDEHVDEVKYLFKAYLD